MFLLIENLSVLLPLLLAVAFMTIIESKVMASLQRRIGPNIVGIYGVLQPFADALNLLSNETLIPNQANKILFFFAPFIFIVFSLLGWAVIPFSNSNSLYYMELAVLYSLAFSSLGVFGVLLAGWSSNNKYAFLGAISSSAQMISYELIFSSVVLCILLCVGSSQYEVIIEAQESVWLAIPLITLLPMYLISILAETNSTPFDLPEAESELVSGFNTEHSSVVFVLFFLSEYASIILISCSSALWFFAGYNTPYWAEPILLFVYYLNINSFLLGLKTCAMAFFFVWIRATLPSMSYDGLMTFCWTGLLPMAIAILFAIPCLLLAFEILN